MCKTDCEIYATCNNNKCKTNRFNNPKDSNNQYGIILSLLTSQEEMNLSSMKNKKFNEIFLQDLVGDHFNIKETTTCQQCSTVAQGTVVLTPLPPILIIGFSSNVGTYSEKESKKYSKDAGKYKLTDGIWYDNENRALQKSDNKKVSRSVNYLNGGLKIQGSEYEVIAVSSHIGTSSVRGHYKAYVKSGSVFHEFDDGTSRASQFKMPKHPTILVLQKKGNSTISSSSSSLSSNGNGEPIHNDNQVIILNDCSTNNNNSIIVT